MTASRRWIRIGLLCLVLTFGVVGLQGQTLPAGAPAQAPAQTPAPEMPRVTLTAGRSTILATDFDITRVAITDPTIADVTVVEPRQVLIDGKGAGTVSLIIWGEGQARVQYDVVVDPGVSLLQRKLQTLFPNEGITSIETADAVVLAGSVSNNDIALQAGELAGAMAPKARLINLLQVPGAANASQQVLLQVRIAEVNRKAVTELGVSIFSGNSGQGGVIGRSTTQQFSSTSLGTIGSQTVLSDLLNIFLFSTNLDLGVLIRALESKGSLQSLAEPNLIAYNGQEANFLAGGELPVPMVQGNSGQVSIEYKEFGVKLGFRPTIAGDMIRLHVKPEVSALDFANGVTVAGFRVPALITRRAETDVELRDGQTFAIAGLLNNVAQDTNDQIPFLGSLPIIGYLFKSKATNQERTELMVLVTPRLVRPLNPDEVPALPTIPNKFLPACPKPPCDAAPIPKGSGG